MKSYRLLFVAAITIIVIASFAGLLSRKNGKEFQLAPKERVKANSPELNGTEVGTGWSVADSPEMAAKETVMMALNSKKNKSPDFAIIFATSGSDLKKILSKTRELLGNKTKIYGGTSDSRGVMTDKGFVKAAEKGYEEALMEGKRGLVIMTITSPDIVFGVGSADLSTYSSAQEASKAALLKAIANAGKLPNELPSLVMITPTIGIEEDVIAGIESIIGKDKVILGGTTGGPVFGVLGEKDVFTQGVSLAVMYTNLPMGWVFEGGFDVTDPHSGIVTKVNGQAIAEIDNRPALDVYDEWLGGEIGKLYKQAERPDLIRDLLTLHPIYRIYTSSEGQKYFLFSHPWPKDNSLKEKSVMTSTNIKEGERIYLSRGGWETLINRIGNLPLNAKAHSGIGVDKKPVFGIGYICAGVLGTIPDNERPKMSYLINYSNKSAPFIAAFTWGEQGYFPGIGNKHGNLLTSFVVIGDK